MKKFYAVVQLTAIIVAIILVNLPSSKAAYAKAGGAYLPPVYWAAFLIVAIPLCLGLTVLIWKTVSREYNNAASAVRPIPSPQEIYWHLGNEWGREPTMEEVQALHQMLHNEKQQQMIRAGMSLGALYLLHDATKHM